ncbi:hypothetical protein KC219_22985, partial [Mycobacterium tuberculosis]|nr:hypothetical protein [Mycobacterium tuberculosis]
AWEARAPALSAVKRRPGVDIAARLGVLSSAALVGFYGQMGTDGDAPADAADRIDSLRTAFSGATVGDRIGAMHNWWGDNGKPDYLGLIAT